MVVEYHAMIPVPNVLVHKRNLRIVVKADVTIACYCVRFTLIISFIETQNVKLTGSNPSYSVFVIT